MSDRECMKREDGMAEYSDQTEIPKSKESFKRYQIGSCKVLEYCNNRDVNC